MEKDQIKGSWDFPIQSDSTIPANQPDIIVQNRLVFQVNVSMMP
jgi:hypothetical protein